MKKFSGEKKEGSAYFRRRVYFEFHIQQGHLIEREHLIEETRLFKEIRYVPYHFALLPTKIHP